MSQKLTGPTHELSECCAAFDAGRVVQPENAADTTASATHLL
jgi:hypothetical protein